MSSEDLVLKLREVAKSTEGPSLPLLLEEAANKIEELNSVIDSLDIHCSSLEYELSYSLSK